MDRSSVDFEALSASIVRCRGSLTRALRVEVSSIPDQREQARIMEKLSQYAIDHGLLLVPIWRGGCLYLHLGNDSSNSRIDYLAVLKYLGISGRISAIDYEEMFDARAEIAIAVSPIDTPSQVH